MKFYFIKKIKSEGKEIQLGWKNIQYIQALRRKENIRWNVETQLFFTTKSRSDDKHPSRIAEWL